MNPKEGRQPPFPEALGVWHLVNRITGKHLGPFSTVVDCVLARSIATPDWGTAIVMDHDAFEHHLHRTKETS